jgi:peroxiredoxin Q/BCP
VKRAAVALLAAPLLVGLVASVAGAGPPKLGAQAPAFALQGSDGRSYTLEQFVGKRGVVLAWFPKAFTPG